VVQTYGIGGENNMGFLDKLQDIGIGNRGPYGGRESGAQYFGRQVDASVTNTKERGLTQALAEAAKGGKISFNKQIELSEMWGIPLQEVMARSKPVNATHENTRLENFGKTAYQLVQSFKKENPGKTITQKDVQGMMEQAGAQSAEDAAYFQAAVQKIQGQAKFMKVGKNERVFPVNLRGEPGEKAIIEPEPETPDETPAEKLQRDKDLATHKQGLKPKVPEAKDKNKLAMDLFKLKAEYKRKNPDTMDINDRRILDEKLVTMAITIEDDPSGPGTKQAGKFYNDWARGPSVYLHIKTNNKWLSDTEETIRVDLPIKDGRQVTAADIRVTLADPKNRGKTLEDVLRGLGAIE
jgi:hypothetical protein